MPRIFDNISVPLAPALKHTLEVSSHADFCVGYFNLRGWQLLDALVERWKGGEGACCRLLVGMQSLPSDELRTARAVLGTDTGLDNATALRLKRRVAEDFRSQLTYGAPSNRDEDGLRCLSAQLKAGKVVVKLFLRYHLHAKLYLLYRDDPNNPITGFLGSSNLTFSGLVKQGEMNVDVLDFDATLKMKSWFEERWSDRWCLDISSELAQIIDESWAREAPPTPFEVYLKMAYHLSSEARSGLAEFGVPRDLRGELFEYQSAAVRIAAHHLQKRGGVLLGDVVGLGKTLMATALSRVMQDEQGTRTLILCPPNLVPMWQDYVERYDLNALVLPTSQTRDLEKLRRFSVVLIDESHNLRNREGKRYKAIRDYIQANDSKVILLSATPYNKSYEDLGNQLRLFLNEDLDLGVRPETLIREMGELEFERNFQVPQRSLRAFERSPYPDDWRELMRLFLIRRTRSFIVANYTEADESGRRFLTFGDGRRNYFPTRVPKAVKFNMEEGSEGDPYGKLYAPEVVETIGRLKLPRYGLGQYVDDQKTPAASGSEATLLGNLGRAGKRLIGFSRTNLFKRLESGGETFLQSLERHALRNFIFLHAIDAGFELPLGSQGADLLDLSQPETDLEPFLFDDESGLEAPEEVRDLHTPAEYQRRAAEIYARYAGPYRGRFKWLSSSYFQKKLRRHLLEDAQALLGLLSSFGGWDAQRDTKFQALWTLLTQTHPQQKILVFSQFADTVQYLEQALRDRGLSHMAAVTGNSHNPTQTAWRFSPRSNSKTCAPEEELRVLLATDVLSEGQNLQDAHIVVNYDLPWAIIRLIQRAGRVDRIGQTSEHILCYTFLPADGVERILKLRERVRARLKENAEVVGTDEHFFEDDAQDQPLIDLYNEKSGLLDGEAEGEVDLASYAYEIWQGATKENPALKKRIEEMPDVVYSSKGHTPTPHDPEGVLVYSKTAEGNDALMWVARDGRSVTQSQLRILQMAQCSPDTPTHPRDPEHHAMVGSALERIAEEEKGLSIGGALGRPSSARFKTYERLKKHLERVKNTLFYNSELEKVLDELYRFPLRQTAADTLNRQLRSGITEERLSDLLLSLRDEDRLCVVEEDSTEVKEPRVICSIGLFR